MSNNNIVMIIGASPTLIMTTSHAENQKVIVKTLHEKLAHVCSLCCKMDCIEDSCALQK